MTSRNRYFFRLFSFAIFRDESFVFLENLSNNYLNYENIGNRRNWVYWFAHRC